MIPNGAAYDNFPPFANSGTRSAPAEAKYAQGMVPADTFPAEWANYFFHGATAGITRLNADTGSIKKEINNVLNNFNITPDGSLTNQLMSALDKLKQQAALAAHPVGSLYWTSSSENPAVTFGGGTWVQIKDRFILAAGDTYANGTTGGAATVTLTEQQMPSHSHTTNYQSHITTTEEGGHDHGGYTGYKQPTFTGIEHAYSIRADQLTAETLASMVLGTTELNIQGGGYSNTGTGMSIGSNKIGYYYIGWKDGGTVENHRHTIATAGAHQHTLSHWHNTDSKGGSQAHENMPPYIAKYCWERTA